MRSKSQRLRKRGGKRTVTISIEKVAYDRGYDTEYPGVVKDGDGHPRARTLMAWR